MKRILLPVAKFGGLDLWNKSRPTLKTFQSLENKHRIQCMTEIVVKETLAFLLFPTIL